MENYEAVLCALQDFSMKPPVIIPEILEEYLRSVAKTGKPLFPWVLIEQLFVAKVRDVLFEFCDDVVNDDLHTASYDTEADRIMQTVRAYRGIPFTIQRMCELLTQPKKQYKEAFKFLRAFSKVVNVSIMIDPCGKPEQSPSPSRRFERRRTKVCANKSKDLSSMRSLPASCNTAGKAATSSDSKRALAAATCLSSGNSYSVSPKKQETPGGARAVNSSASWLEKRGLEVAQPPVVMSEMVEIHRDMEDDKQSITRCYENDKSKTSSPTTRKPMEDITGLQHSDRQEGAPFSEKFGAKHRRKRKLEKKCNVNQNLCGGSRRSNSEEKINKLAESADVKSDNRKKRKYNVNPSTSPFKNKVSDGSSEVTMTDASLTSASQPESPPKYTPKCSPVSSPECPSPPLPESDIPSRSQVAATVESSASVLKVCASAASRCVVKSPLPPSITKSSDNAALSSSVLSKASASYPSEADALHSLPGSSVQDISEVDSSVNVPGGFSTSESPAAWDYIPQILACESLLPLSANDEEEYFVSREGGQEDRETDSMAEPVTVLENLGPSTVPKTLTVTGSLSLSNVGEEKDHVSKESRQEDISGLEDIVTDNMKKPVTSLGSHVPSTAAETLTSTGSSSLLIADEEKGCVSKESLLEGSVTENTAEPMTSIESHLPSTVPNSLNVIGSLTLSIAEKEKDFVSKESRQKDMATHDTADPVALLENHGPSTVPKKLTVTGSLSLLVNDKEKDSVRKESGQKDKVTDSTAEPVLSLENNGSLPVPKTLTVCR